MEKQSEKRDLSGFTMFPCVVPDRGVSDETMNQALSRLNEMVNRDRPAKPKSAPTPKKKAKAWWRFW